jgi:hypothetical protein
LRQALFLVKAWSLAYLAQKSNAGPAIVVPIGKAAITIEPLAAVRQAHAQIRYIARAASLDQFA